MPLMQPDWSVLDMAQLPEWPEYASADSATPDGQRGIVAATLTPPNPEAVKVWIPVNMPATHKMTDTLVKDAVNVVLSSEAK